MQSARRPYLCPRHRLRLRPAVYRHFSAKSSRRGKGSHRSLGSMAPGPTNELDSDSELADEEVDALLDALDALYQLADEDPAEALEMFQSFPEEVRLHREFRIAEAAIEKSANRIDVAIEKLERLLEEDPEDADIHHILGDALEDAGRAAEAQAHFIKTWELDAEQVVEVPPSVVARIETVAKTTLADLPSPFRDKLEGVPVFVAPRPTRQDVEGGLDPRALGMFDGLNMADRDAPLEPVPPSRIFIYAQNLMAEFDDESLDEQVMVTVLHEVGHYFGLDEEDMVRLGLD